MQPRVCFESTLSDSLALFAGNPKWQHKPTPLLQAMHYALFPRGARLRPRLCLAIAADLQAEAQAGAAAVAIELLHSASLVHDDLPCFDDAVERRGKQAVHRKFGEACAVLTGDALLALSFRVLAQGCAQQSFVEISEAACALMQGQAQELSVDASLPAYHQQKTACLFAVAAAAGARAAGQDPTAFALLGERIGRMYQIADDLFDVGSPTADDSKARGRDVALLRPNFALAHGTGAAQQALAQALAEIQAQADVLLPGPGALQEYVLMLQRRFAPLVQPAAAFTIAGASNQVAAVSECAAATAAPA